MSLQLFQEVDKLVDKQEFEKILLTLEEDLIKYETASKDLQYYKDQLSFIDKINPFGERDKKGEILKIEYEMADIAKIYNRDMKVIKEKSAAAIKSIDAFVARFQMDWLVRSIKEIRARSFNNPRNRISNNVQIIGREDSIRRASELDHTLKQTYGIAYEQCPPYAQFIKGYMHYVVDPYQLPLKLKAP